MHYCKRWLKNYGKYKLWKWRACFSFKFDQGDWDKTKKATPNAASIKQPKTNFEFGLPSIIAYSQRNITVPRPARSCRLFFQDLFLFFIFSQKHVLQYATEMPAFQPAILSSFLIRKVVCRSSLCKSNKYISCSRSKRKHIFWPFPPFCFKRWKQAVYACQK